MGQHAFIIDGKVGAWVVFVPNPKKHKRWQVKVHKQGMYPYVDSSFDTESEAVKRWEEIKEYYKPVDD